MKSLSKEDYLKLIESVRDEEENCDDVVEMTYSDAWIPAESPAKELLERAKIAASHGKIDVLKYRKEQIREAIYKCVNLQVGEFTIHINRYNGRPTDRKLAGPLTLNITVMGMRYKTPSGAPCRMEYKFDFFQDNRFTERPWISYFDSAGYGKDIPVETVVEIIRWMQALRRMNAFL